MIIVSQDKKKITDRMELWVDLAINTYYGVFCINVRGEDTCLGIYETEERAKEVLQEIIKKYSSYLELEGRPAILQGQVEITPAVFNIPKVYEMPEE